VRQSAEDRIYGLIPRLKRINRKAKIVLTGCLVYREDVKKKVGDRVDIWLPIVDLANLGKRIQEEKRDQSSFTCPAPQCRGWERGGFAEDESGVCYSPLERGVPASGGDGVCYSPGQDYLKIKPKYSSRFKAFVPIGNGCNNFCAYCVVPYARGPEVYRPAEEIISEVKGLVNKGYKEITLIAQNVNSYNNANPRILMSASGQANIDTQPQEINFPTLLKMVNDIKGDFWLRFATSHPKDMSDELIATVAVSRKVCEHIHLPVQAGDDEVLRRMNRNYTVSHYKSLIKKIRQAYKKREEGSGWRLPPAITTDVIVGFPGETREQFENTVKLFWEIKFDMAYIAQYSPRPGTAAAKMTDDIPPEEKKRREKELTAVLRQTARTNNEQYLGRVVEALVEGVNKKGEWFGRTRTNKNVKIKGIKRGEDLVGRIVKVEIISAQDFGLVGQIKK
jgi:tRNA-2-methylthio-N6-dimethylallyladenosine synthase